MRTGIICFALLSVAVYGLLIGVPTIDRWERANAYPYGRMCDPNLFNFYQSSCHDNPTSPHHPAIPSAE
jgi:hypothetical protein